MSAHASQAFSIAHCTDSEDLPTDLHLGGGGGTVANKHSGGGAGGSHRNNTNISYTLRIHLSLKVYSLRAT